MCGVDGMVIDDGTVLRAGRGPLPRLHHHRRRGEDPRLDGGVAADRVAAAAGALHLGHRAVGHLPGRRPALPRRHRRRLPRRRRLQGGVPVHDLAGHQPGRGAGPAGPDQLLRRAGLRGLRQPLVRGRASGSGSSRPAARTASRRTAPRPCTSCGRRRATRSSGRTPTARSRRRTWACRGRSRRRSPTSSASAPSPARPTRTRCASTWSGCCPVDRQTVLPEGSQIVEFCADERAARRRRCRCSATSPPATAAPSSGGPSPWPWSRAGASRIGDTVHVPVNGTLVPVEVTGSVLVDPEGARRDG